MGTRNGAYLTDIAIHQAPPPKVGETILWDGRDDSGRRNGVTGLCVRVRPSGGRTFYYMGRNYAGKLRKIKLGSTETLTLAQARETARDKIKALADPLDPIHEDKRVRPSATESKAVESYTLWDAWQGYERDLLRLVRSGQRSPRTVANYKAHVTDHLRDWKGKTLANIGRDPAAVSELHATIAETRGDRTADAVMATLKAIYNYGLRMYDGLPVNPVSRAVKIQRPTRRRDAAITDTELPEWWKVVSQLPGVRRDAHLFALLSGLRQGLDADTGGGCGVCTMQWEYVDWDKNTLTLPRTKTINATSDAAVIPLSEAQMKILKRRYADRPNGNPWVWPSKAKAGHIGQLRLKNAGKSLFPKDGNCYRHTFTSYARRVGVTESDRRVLRGDVPVTILEGYESLDVLLEHIRGEQERVSQKLIELAGIEI